MAITEIEAMVIEEMIIEIIQDTTMIEGVMVEEETEMIETEGKGEMKGNPEENGKIGIRGTNEKDQSLGQEKEMKKDPENSFEMIRTDRRYEVTILARTFKNCILMMLFLEISVTLKSPQR